MPRSIFLLGPDHWDDDVEVPAPLWAAEALGKEPHPFTPRHLRQAAAGLIAKEDPARGGIVMDATGQRPDEQDGDFFHRLETEHSVDAYFIIVPMQTKVLGTVFEGGMLERDFHYGRSPQIVLFLEEGFAEHEGAGAYRFTAKGKRTRYLTTLAARAHHVQFWGTFEDLIDGVLQWALIDA